MSTRKLSSWTAFFVNFNYKQRETGALGAYGQFERKKKPFYTRGKMANGSSVPRGIILCNNRRKNTEGVFIDLFFNNTNVYSRGPTPRSSG